MSKRSARASTTLPLPSSPHCTPTTTRLFDILNRLTDTVDSPHSPQSSFESSLPSGQAPDVILRRLRCQLRTGDCQLQLQVLLEHLPDCLFPACPDQLLADLSVLKQEKCRDTADVVLAGERQVVIHVQLAHLGAASILAGDSLHRR